MFVIPGRAEGANPESRSAHSSNLHQGVWIPDRRFTASGMTVDRLYRKSSGLNSIGLPCGVRSAA